MPSKKRKYNARFPAGRIKKIMQTDEEVGKVAQAVPIIISRTLELFVESLLGKALQVTTARNAKTLSPSHVKQCILGEARFDFLRDLVKNIPDVSVAEEKELMSAESSPNSSSIPEAPPRRLREDSNSSSSCDVIRVPQLPHPNTREHLKMRLKRHLSEADANKHKSEASTSTKIEATPIIPTLTPIVTHKEPVFPPATITVPDAAIDLSKKEVKPVRTANFYHETLVVSEDLPSSSVIKPNPTYSTSQPSTSYTNLNPVEPVRKVEIPKPFTHNASPRTPVTPITPVINIDFSKNLSIPEIKVLDKTAANIVVPKTEAKIKHVSRQNSKSKIEVKKAEPKPVPKIQPVPIDIDSLNSGNPQIDEDYDT